MRRLLKTTGKTMVTLAMLLLMLPVYYLLLAGMGQAERLNDRYCGKRKWLRQLEQERKSVYQTAKAEPA